jgi:hypothetical protein
MKSTYIVVYQEYIKAPKDKYSLVFLHSAPGGGHAKKNTGSRFTQKQERIGSQYKSKMSDIIATSF